MAAKLVSRKEMHRKCMWVAAFDVSLRLSVHRDRPCDCALGWTLCKGFCVW